MTEQASAITQDVHAIQPPLEQAMDAPMLRPVLEKERIAEIDVLRGFVLLGILIMNIQAFAMPVMAYTNPTAFGDLTGANYWVWFLSHVLADQKFMTIFAMLFGAGVVLMTSRIEAKGRSSASTHYRRMGWLILFGLLHAHLLWYGDILYTYGMCGLVVWLMRRWRPIALILVGLAALAVPVLINLLFAALSSLSPEEFATKMAPMWTPPETVIQAEIDAYRGGWLEQMAQRVPGALMLEVMVFAIWGVWRAGGLMLVGMALYKLGVFSGRCSSWTYAAMLVLGAGIGIPATVLEIRLHEASGWEVVQSMFVISNIHYAASILVSFGWIGGIMLLCRSRGLMQLLRPVAAVGRTALSNYLFQSIICTAIFYGHGLGLFAELTRMEQLGVVVGVWLVQLAVSPLWLHYFLFGPFEWLWRSLTYLRIQPLLRPKMEPLSAAGS